jgi:hypothetical protein
MKASSLELSESVNVMSFGAVGDGTVDDTEAIRAAFAAAGTSKTVWFPAGTYAISSPIRLTDAYRFDGDNATIKALSGFTGLPIQKAAAAGGGTRIFSALFIFLSGYYWDTAGNRPKDAYIGQGITLDCDDIADNGLFMERMVYAYVGCNVIKAHGDAIEFGIYNWGSLLDSNTIRLFRGAGMVFDNASNGVTIANPTIYGEDIRGAYGIKFLDGNDSNGITIDGGIIETVEYGVLIGTTTGPIEIAGMFFEDIKYSCIRSVGDDNRQVGPIGVSSCKLTSNSTATNTVYAKKTYMIVSGCRFFNVSGATYDFETSDDGTSIIVSRDNYFSGGYPLIEPGSYIIRESAATNTRLIGGNVAGKQEALWLENAYPSGSADAVAAVFRLRRTENDYSFDAASIVAGKEGQWSGTESTIDSYLALWLIRDQNEFEAMRINSNGSVGVGLTDPGSKLQINGNAAIGYSTNTAGPTNGLAVSGALGVGTNVPGNYHANANNLVVYEAGNPGITIANPSGSYIGSLFFARGTSGSDPFKGELSYDHGSDQMRFGTAGGHKMYLDSSGNLQATGKVRADNGFNINGTNGASGSFTTADGKTVTVSGGIITSIV